jgi:hypothetical protein
MFEDFLDKMPFLYAFVPANIISKVQDKLHFLSLNQEAIYIY